MDDLLRKLFFWFVLLVFGAFVVGFVRGLLGEYFPLACCGLGLLLACRISAAVWGHSA